MEGSTAKLYSSSFTWIRGLSTGQSPKRSYPHCIRATHRVALLNMQSYVKGCMSALRNGTSGNKMMFSSTTTSERTATTTPSSSNVRLSPPTGAASPQKTPSPARPLVVEKDGKSFLLLDTRRFKLKPRIIRKRLEKMKNYIGKERDIKYSPQRLNIICQLVRDMTVPQAIEQLAYQKKEKSPLVSEILQRTAKLAHQRDGLPMSCLEVAECFATPATSLKRIMIMGRGRTGRMTRRRSHLRVRLREIDFPLRIVLAPSVNQKKQWFLRQQQAEYEKEQLRKEREEINQLQSQLK